MAKRKYHFPDWLFYIISAVLIVAVYLCINNANTLKSTEQQLITARDSVKISNALFQQGELTRIYNNDNTTYAVIQMNIIFLNSENKLENKYGEINELIEPNDYLRIDKDKYSWNGKCLFYAFTLNKTFIENGLRKTEQILITGSFSKNVQNGILRIIE